MSQNTKHTSGLDDVEYDQSGSDFSTSEGALGANILVVDDDIIIQNQIKYILEEKNYKVTISSSGLASLETYERINPEMVLMDAVMPGMSGFEACVELVNRYGKNVAPIVIITSLNDTDSVEKAFSVGVSDYITKPIHWPVLLKRIERIVSGNRNKIKLDKERIKARTQRERYQKQLMQTHKMEALGKLTGGIAHEFNNLLATIMGYSELLKVFLESGNTEKCTAYVNEITIASERSRDLIKKISNYGHEEKMDCKVTNPGLILDEVKTLLQATLTSDIQIKIDVEENIPDINIGPEKFHQTIMNLCINARDAMSGKGDIHVNVYTKMVAETVCDSCNQIFSGSYVCMDILDTGTGIDKENLEKIFDPFFSSKPVGRCTGMGLSEVHGILHQYRGHITVKTEKNRGSKFSLYFLVN